MSDTVGVMIIGLKGAVATTLVAAGIVARRGSDISFRLPSDQDPVFCDLELTPLSAMRFGGWDISSSTLSESLAYHRVLSQDIIDQIEPDLDSVWSRPGAYLHPTPIHGALDQHAQTPQRIQSLREITSRLRRDLSDFKREANVSSVVVLDLSSTARPLADSPIQHDIEAFEHLLDSPIAESLAHNVISAGNLYAYAAIREGCPCVNFTPSTTFDLPALIALAEQERVPLCGKDGKTGQTLYKTALAPLFKQRALRVRGWYSTNILGNRDGEVLDQPDHRQTKIESKKSVLSELLGEDDLDHQVHIHYYKPRGDAKEAWDNIDFEGWFGVPMQMKINWLGSDSILAAPLAADLVRWMVYFHQRDEGGVVSELASYFKSPLKFQNHDFFEQVTALHDLIITHQYSRES